MPPPRLRPAEFTPAQRWDQHRSGHLLLAEEHLRLAARRLELVGVADPESARLAMVVFRLASRVRGDRLEVAA